MAEIQQNAIIIDAQLQIDDHGFLSAWIMLDYGGGSQQGFGGYTLYLPKGCPNHSKWGTAGHFIYRVLEIAGVENWNALKGKAVRVKHDYCSVSAIGHIIKNDWFCPREDFKDMEYKDVAG